MNSLKLFFTYFGGKWRVAKYYPSPKYGTVIEPFAGSAGYSLHYPRKSVMLFDVDPIISAVWNYLIKVDEREILGLPDVVEDVRHLNACQEARWLIGFWLNKGMTAPCNIPGKWMRDHLRQGTRLNSYWGSGIKIRLASQLKYIRHWKVENMSYDRVTNREATWFIDPPYQGLNHYKFHNIDYSDLSEFCQSRKGQVIVCERFGASWLNFIEFRSIKTLEGAHGSHINREVVWLR